MLFLVLSTVVTTGISGNKEFQKEGVSFIRQKYKRAACGPSHTRVNGNAPCQGEEIYRESFDNLDYNRWSHELLMSPEPVSFYSHIINLILIYNINDIIYIHNTVV